MSVVSNFVQPDTAPDYFIDFLDLLDNHAGVRNMRLATAKRMKLAAGHKVLDLGCGIGGATFLLADLIGPTGLATGVDVSSALIDVARRRAANQPGLEFRSGSAHAIPYPNGFFDVAYCERVFLYLRDRLGAIHEMKRVVKPGGSVWLIDTDFDSMAIYSTNRALTRKMTSIVAASVPNPNSARDLPALAKQAGLKNITTETCAVATPHEFLLHAMGGRRLCVEHAGKQKNHGGISGGRPAQPAAVSAMASLSAQETAAHFSRVGKARPRA
jgi:ubiquinone/menaquinone biosynthesis C-methylase UbiE